jgi:hypothetical protein
MDQFGTHFPKITEGGSHLAPFWLPLAPFGLALRPFCCHCGTPWLPVGSLLAPFGSLLIHFSSILCCSLLSLYFLGLLSLVSGLAAFISESSYEFHSIRILISVSGRIFL